MTDFLLEGPDDAAFTILLGHGAGAPMDSKSMVAVSAALAAAGFRVARFEFAYMAARRSGSRRPPPRAEKLVHEYRSAIEALVVGNHLIIGGKSMGGRVASMLADELYATGQIAGLLCLGYPFHPPGKPQNLRTQHLEELCSPALICQGTRDEFGTASEVATYALSKQIEFLWLEDGDHDFKPRKTISGFTTTDHLTTIAETVKRWTKSLR
ncbi:MAG: alpha/beta hydrolase family protein [Phyllobacterium sp.]